MREITITTINGLWNETINLGTRGENLATKIMIDISEWAEEFGVGTPQLLVQRPDDSLPYIAVISYIGNIVTWVVTNTDVAQSGIGHLELRYTVNSIVVKSKIFKTCINTSLDEPGPTPAPYTAWVEQVLAAAAAIQVDLSGKQNTLIPSTGITIAQDGKTISANIPSYSVSSGLTLANNVFGIDFNTVQQKLTAGSGISINNNVISATGGGGKTLYRHSISARYSKQRLSFWAITSDENAYTLDTLPWPTYGIGTYEDATYKAAIAIWIRVGGSGLDVKYICDFTTDTFLSTISCNSITDTVTEI